MDKELCQNIGLPLDKFQSQGCSLGVHDVQHVEEAEHIADSNQRTADDVVYQRWGTRVT